MALTNSRRPAGRVVGFAAGAVLLLAMCGCNQYWERRDTVSLGVGDAVAANKVTHTVDPWPPEAEKERYDANGKRIASAVERYETNQEYSPGKLRSSPAKGDGSDKSANGSEKTAKE